MCVPLLFIMLPACPNKNWDLCKVDIEKSVVTRHLIKQKISHIHE